MKHIKIVAVFILMIVAASAQAQSNSGTMNTKNQDLVCHLDDFLSTIVYVDSRTVLDRQVNALSTKVIERPTQNMRANNNRLSPVILRNVIRGNCPQCQTILYSSPDNPSIINKLEVTPNSAKLTMNVDSNGAPQTPSFTASGPCGGNRGL